MSGDVTEQALSRLSHLPDSDNPAEMIAAQKYYNVEFTGGEISGVTISDLGAPLAIADGGTGETTANDALNALLPDQTGNNLKFLQSVSGNTQWTEVTGTGTVTSVSVVTANGVSGSVANATTTPAITLTLGAITPTSVGTGSLTATGGTIQLDAATTIDLTAVGAISIESSTSDLNITSQSGAVEIDSGLQFFLTAPSAFFDCDTEIGGNLDVTAITSGAWNGSIIASTYGGTGNGFTKFTGPTTSEKTFTLPNSNATLLYSGGALGTPASGTLTNCTGLPGSALTSATLGSGVGFSATSYSAGTKSSGTYTPDPANGNFQHATNGGAHTLAPPSTVCNIIVEYLNNSSAGAITTSGFTKVTGDSFTTTDTNKFQCFITKTQNYSSLNVVALQ